MRSTHALVAVLAVLVASLALGGAMASAQQSQDHTGKNEGQGKASGKAPAKGHGQLMTEQRADILKAERKGMDGLNKPNAQNKAQQAPKSAQKCKKGFAGPYPCKNVDLAGFIPLAKMSATSANDMWGWTDPKTGRDYALVGLSNGTGFVDVTNPKRPRYLGKLPTQTEDSLWRDIKVYKNYAFVVSEADNHGMQVFDLTELRGLKQDYTREFDTDAYYGEFGSAHNIAINKDSGYAYALGSDTCDGGPHMIDISSPLLPEKAGCASGDGYTHDAQIVTYQGPDKKYQGREILFGSNEDTLTIYDVTDKDNPEVISKTTYEGASYTHQGSLTPNSRYFIFGDELDETSNGNRTRTYVLDVSDLENPLGPNSYTAETAAIDHNLYTEGRYVHQANYRAGYRLLKDRNLSEAQFKEVGYFDIYPTNDAPAFNGAWGVYPYFSNGVVGINGIEQGLYVLDPQLGPKGQ